MGGLAGGFWLVTYCLCGLALANGTEGHMPGPDGDSVMSDILLEHRDFWKSNRENFCGVERGFCWFARVSGNDADTQLIGWHIQALAGNGRQCDTPSSALMFFRGSEGIAYGFKVLANGPFTWDGSAGGKDCAANIIFEPFVFIDTSQEVGCGDEIDNVFSGGPSHIPGAYPNKKLQTSFGYTVEWNRTNRPTQGCFNRDPRTQVAGSDILSVRKILGAFENRPLSGIDACPSGVGTIQSGLSGLAGEPQRHENADGAKNADNKRPSGPVRLPLSRPHSPPLYAILGFGIFLGTGVGILLNLGLDSAWEGRTSKAIWLLGTLTGGLAALVAAALLFS